MRENPYANEVIQIAQSKLGLAEQGGKNQGPIVEWSIAEWSDDSPGEWAKWCAGFACTCLLYAGAPVRSVASLSCQRLWDRCEQRGYARKASLDDEPTSGELIFFGEHHLEHVGLVESVFDGQVVTIEGNADDEVQRREYSLSDPWIYGYALVV